MTLARPGHRKPPATNQPVKETTMTTSTAAKPATVTNPHAFITKLMGWALIATVLGGLWGAGHDPQHAGISAAAIVAAIGIYLFHKVRAITWNSRNRALLEQQ